MHMTPMEIDALYYPSDPMHEYNKDAMLEKIILISTAYFCLGTEFRFLSQDTPGSTP